MSIKIIKSETQYKAMLQRLDEIFHPKNEAEQDEFDLLVLLINHYESQQYYIEESDPIQVILAKMKYLELKQKDLITLLGSKSTVSKILNYKKN